MNIVDAIKHVWGPSVGEMAGEWHQRRRGHTIENNLFTEYGGGFSREQLRTQRRAYRADKARFEGPALRDSTSDKVTAAEMDRIIESDLT